MKNIYNVFKKEFDKIIKFPRAIFSTLLLPGLIIFIVYFSIGNLMKTQINDVEEHKSIIHAINAPSSFKELITEEFLIDLVDSTLDQEALSKLVESDGVEAAIIFPADFNTLVENRELPNVLIIYKEGNLNSSAALSKLQALLEAQKNLILVKEGINPKVIEVNIKDVAEAGAGAAMFMSMIFPMILISLIFGASMGIGSEAIAGEKERGTLAKLLLLPIKRSDIALGKVASTTILTVLSGISSFIGIMASLPFMADSMALGEGVNYSLVSYLSIFGLVLLVAIFASVMLLIISTFAKNVKEASAYAMPLFLVAMFLPLVNMMSMGKEAPIYFYLIPYYNITLGFSNLFAMNMSTVNYLLIIGSNLAVIVLFVFVLIRLFKNENVLFGK